MPHQPTVSLISLGCPKTVVDSEKILGQVAEAGGLICARAEDAEVIVINTCSFIEEAIEESLEVIHEAVAHKKAGRCRALIVSGCLAQRFGAQLRAQIPEVDVWVGVDEEHRVAELCRAAAEEKLEHCARLQTARTREPLHSHAGRLRITPRHYAYLKISEGCDNVCAFCIIPKIRGRHRSKPSETVLEEARELAADGVAELILVAQDSTDYGRDLYGGRQLAPLLHDLARVPGLRWMRLLYAFPAHFGDDLIDEVAANERLCKYLDIPIQHINDQILRRMRREVGRRETESLIQRLRERVPGIVLRTSVIVGFPGETDEQFEELVEFLHAARFDRLGAFRYSAEEGTAAFRHPDAVPETVKQQRLDQLMEVQKAIAFEKARAVVGRKLEILIDRLGDRRSGVWEGRSYGEAPEIDGVIHVQGRDLKPGGFYDCEIVGADGYDLIARPVASPFRAPARALRVLAPANGTGDSSSCRPRRL
ncbi:MAG: 30S ribosomal protein S12 methylthiotransferase RimO [Planctomycetes bacterium]|nr:30S ribosomal protein S12 methylthiotransferase RimO [Planctomycetota bacterium]